MKATINNQNRLDYHIWVGEDGYYVQFYTLDGDTVPVEYEELDYPVDNAGPFDSRKAALSFAQALKRQGVADDGSETTATVASPVPQDWQAMLAQDADYMQFVALTEADYWGAMNP